MAPTNILRDELGSPGSSVLGLTPNQVMTISKAFKTAVRRLLGAPAQGPRRLRDNGGSRYSIRPIVALVASSLVSTAAQSEDSPAKDAPGFESTIRPFVERYCSRCHGERRQRADLDLDEYLEAAKPDQHREIWSKVLHMVKQHEMPPEKSRQPSAEERADVVRWLDNEINRFECDGDIDPGRVTLRRLNRSEYQNTVRDLLGVSFNAGTTFPADEVGYGFDNIGDNLSIPTLLFEKYLDAAEEIVEAAVDRDYLAYFAPRRLQAERLNYPDHAHPTGNACLLIGREGEASGKVRVEHDGRYAFRARAYGQQAGPDVVRMALRIDGKPIREFEVKAEEENPATYSAEVDLRAGEHAFGVAYLNNYLMPNHPDPKLRGDRNLVVDWLEVELREIHSRAAGSAASAKASPKPSHRRIFSQSLSGDFEQTATRILRDFGRRAYRRPLGERDLNRLLRLVNGARQAGDSRADAVLVGIKAALVSPYFLFRVEAGAEVSTRPDVERLDDYSLASRLSYFIWSSMPDPELFALAERGELGRVEVLEAQVRRMLTDDRAAAFTQNFAGQWLQVRLLETTTPDPGTYPKFDAGLKRAMAEETLRFFGVVLRENRSLLELIDADFSVLNERLARHYGIDGVQGEEFRKVALAGRARGGVLTQASFLTLTSNPTRTSPVKRGKWILEQILGTPPLPPPPDVEDLAEDEEAILSGSLRQRMEEHRKNPNCAVCHRRMDALGFAFENFDGVGAWREFDGKFLIDPAGTLPDGRNFSGAQELRRILLSEKEQIARNLAEKVLTYALGRGLEYYDQCAVREIVEATAADEYRLQRLIMTVVTTDPFLFRRRP